MPTTVKENDFQLGGLQDARQIVRWAFGAKEGEVSEPFSIKDDFIVAIVDRKIKEGTPDVKTARPMVESTIRNIKKAEEIKTKLNNPTTLEAAAKVYNQQVLTTGADSTLTFDAQIINGVGNEPKVAGAAFDKDFQTKVSPPFWKYGRVCYKSKQHCCQGAGNTRNARSTKNSGNKPCFTISTGPIFCRIKENGNDKRL